MIMFLVTTKIHFQAGLVFSSVLLFPSIAAVWPAPQSPHLENGFLIISCWCKKLESLCIPKVEPLSGGRLQVLNATC